MKKWMSAGLALSVFLSCELAQADFWGGDDVILSQILAKTIEELYQLQRILRTGSDTLGLLQDINRGLNDSVAMAQTLGVHLDPGVYAGLGTVNEGLRLVQQTFGVTPRSPLAPVEQNTDQTVAEALTLNDQATDYTVRLDQVGENIKSYSHIVSPGGAAKLTAQGVGVLIHVMNEQMRVNNQGLKLQAQALALQNKHEKDQTGQYMAEAERLKTEMMTTDAQFEFPRF